MNTVANENLKSLYAYYGVPEIPLNINDKLGTLADQQNIHNMEYGIGQKKLDAYDAYRQGMQNQQALPEGRDSELWSNRASTAGQIQKLGYEDRMRRDSEFLRQKTIRDNEIRAQQSKEAAAKWDANNPAAERQYNWFEGLFR